VSCSSCEPDPAPASRNFSQADYVLVRVNGRIVDNAMRGTPGINGWVRVLDEPIKLCSSCGDLRSTVLVGEVHLLRVR